MLFCEAPSFTPWRPDFTASERPSPRWTRMTVEGVELVNSIEDAAWQHQDERGLQVLLCEECGIEGCAQGDWVRVVRLADALLWVPSWRSGEHGQDADEFGPPAYLREHGAVLMCVAAW